MSLRSFLVLRHALHWFQQPCLHKLELFHTDSPTHLQSHTPTVPHTYSHILVICIWLCIHQWNNITYRLNGGNYGLVEGGQKSLAFVLLTGGLTELLRIGVKKDDQDTGQEKMVTADDLFERVGKATRNNNVVLTNVDKVPSLPFYRFTVLPSSMSSNIKDGNKQGEKPQLKQPPITFLKWWSSSALNVTKLPAITTPSASPFHSSHALLPNSYFPSLNGSWKWFCTSLSDRGVLSTLHWFIHCVTKEW